VVQTHQVHDRGVQVVDMETIFNGIQTEIIGGTVGLPAFHTADLDRDGRISLPEITRMIELYNTRFGPTRTGNYDVAPSTSSDGFIPDSARTATASVQLSRYHSADIDRNGKITLNELSRVLEYYNYRTATVRTGAYHAQAGTEDSFTPGP
jgi:hypothetical protein